MPVVVLPRCPHCSGPMPSSKSRGRPRRWCSDRCRREASRARVAERDGGWESLGSALAEIPDDPLTVRRATLEALADTLEGAPAAPPEDQLAECIRHAQVVAFRLRRLAPEVAPALRGRALGLAESITAGLARHFKEVIG